MLRHLAPFREIILTKTGNLTLTPPPPSPASLTFPQYPSPSSPHLSSFFSHLSPHSSSSSSLQYLLRTILLLPLSNLLILPPDLYCTPPFSSLSSSSFPSSSISPSSSLIPSYPLLPFIPFLQHFLPSVSLIVPLSPHLSFLPVSPFPNLPFSPSRLFLPSFLSALLPSPPLSTTSTPPPSCPPLHLPNISSHPLSLPPSCKCFPPGRFRIWESFSARQESSPGGGRSAEILST
jgi:hypothetical protein